MDARPLLISRLAEDLIGPSAIDEVLEDKPSDRYLTGILFPQQTHIGPDEDDRLDAAGGEDEEEDGAAEEVPTSAMRKPSAAGVSFQTTTREDVARLKVRVCGGTYTRHDRRVLQQEAGEPLAQQPASGRRYVWRRSDHDFQIDLIVPDPRGRDHKLADYGLDGFRLHVTHSLADESFLITLVLVNDNKVTDHEPRRPDEMAVFQVALEVRPTSDTQLIARPTVVLAGDDDSRASQLLYHASREFAVGHTCGARWELGSDSESTASMVATTWLPEHAVRMVSAAGADELTKALAAIEKDPLLAENLTDPALDFGRILGSIPDGYELWIRRQKESLAGMPPDLRRQARRHLRECHRAALRIRRGIALIGTDEQVRAAFLLMNRAMSIQRRWTDARKRPLRWYPFQLAFILQSLESVANPKSKYRAVMDLLWFPTGGGKTEAYLGLIAFTLFLRRMRRAKEADRGGGICCIMRYTLRLLTLQQFERATALILACEYLRTGHEIPLRTPHLDRTATISIGLWVGQSATPNNFAEAEEALVSTYAPSTPRQLTGCPACGTRLTWSADSASERIVVSCGSADCELARALRAFPVHTIDSQIYAERPTLLFGTIDKFAQIVRSSETTALFNAGSAPPELIIQDELHLISGPLGTLAGIYEIAIDLICSREGCRPKVIGSTATIRRAREQVRALFDRDVAQFPPPGIIAEDSCFAVIPAGARDRRYLGVTTAGRSAKFTLQAVYGSLLQGATAITDNDVRDGYHTLVGYFNSLRELGGAVVLTQDDVDATLRLIAGRRQETQRRAREVVELTSRVSQREIRDLLDRLSFAWTKDDAVDVVLATNMISVGVDVGRLALMVVMGQPKGIAEYIQSTSRVGRDANAGLVVTVFNNAKARDRSHFESFVGWHQVLYRGVEPTSVTPFAARARDRALHAAVVAIARHLVAGLRDRPDLNVSRRQQLEPLVATIAERAMRIDPEESEMTRNEVTEILELWENRAHVLDRYWSDHHVRTGLLIGAEAAAAKQLAGRAPDRAWPTLNSMRNVEAGTPFCLTEGLR